MKLHEQRVREINCSLGLLEDKRKGEESFDMEDIADRKLHINLMLMMLMETATMNETNIEFVLAASTEAEVSVIERQMKELGVQVTFADNRHLGKLTLEILRGLFSAEEPSLAALTAFYS
jgi:hypothetical protein